MDNDHGQPDSKRPRMTGPAPGSPWTGPPSRELPPISTAAPYPQHTPPYSRPHENDSLYRRHSAHTEHQQYDLDSRRPTSGPHVYHQPGTQPPPQSQSYGGHREQAMMKREPEEVAPYRPGSTGSAQDHNVTPIHPLPIDGRYQPALPQPYTLPQHSGPQPFQPGPAYANPQSPMHGGNPYGHAPYPAQGPPQGQDPYASVTYPPAVAATQKRKATRAAQACDSCRTLKAKCDEGRPNCVTCKEKGIQCVYRDPPPKQQDKTVAEWMDVMNRSNEILIENFTKQLHQAMRDVHDGVRNEVQGLKIAVDNVYVVVRRQQGEESGAGEHFKDEPEDTDNKTASSTQPPAMLAPEALSLGSDSEPENAHGSTFTLNASQQLLLERPPETEGPAVEEEEDGPPVNPGESSIPVNHTTGAARLLLVRPISALAKGVMESEKIKNEKYPMLQEERRGLIRLYGRGEGIERLPGYDRDPLTDNEVVTVGTPGSNDASSEAATPPPGDEWGQLGGLTPPGEHIARGVINAEGMPDFSSSTVMGLVASFKEHINNMHPILPPKQLDALVRLFLRSVDDQLRPKQVSQLVTAVRDHSSKGPSAGFVVNPGIPDSPGNKRKRRSPGPDVYELPVVLEHKHGHPPRTIGSALILLVMALGKICQATGKINDCVPDGLPNTSAFSPTIRNGHPPSSSQSSPAMSNQSGLPSPREGDPSQPRSRRPSLEGTYQNITGIKPKNMDAIPGLEYFGLATDILGNQLGGNSLQHVHANILASLYHGQLARPVESHAYLHQASRSLQTILRPKLDRLKKLHAASAIPPAKDNPLIFAFWTILQLESDLIAELPLPHSGILTYEFDMPGPNLQAAVDVDKFDDLVIQSYAAQLYMRKHLNFLHNMMYRPENDSESNSKNSYHFPTIDISLTNLEKLMQTAPGLQWKEDGPPADDILEARLRAKYYGAKVITYRPALLKILKHSHAAREQPRDSSERTDETTPEKYQEDYKPGIVNLPPIDQGATRMEDIDPKFHDYASNCVKALIKSTTAFHGLGDPGSKRFIVTNIWGTAHAQWGNILTLQAAYADPILRPLIDKRVLRSLYNKTMSFLRFTAQPKSALAIDARILEHVAIRIGLIKGPSVQGQGSSSFSSTASGDVTMTGQ